MILRSIFRFCLELLLCFGSYISCLLCEGNYGYDGEFTGTRFSLTNCGEEKFIVPNLDIDSCLLRL